MAVCGHLVSPNLSPSLFSHRQPTAVVKSSASSSSSAPQNPPKLLNFPKKTLAISCVATTGLSPSRSSLRQRTAAIKFSAFSSGSAPQNPKLFILPKKTLAISCVTTTGLLLNLSSPFLLRSGGGGGGGPFGGGGGGNGGGGGGFWSRIFYPAAIAKDEDSPEWDSHGLPADTVFQLNKLSGFRKYKLSDISFFDRRRRETVGTDDSFFGMVSLRVGGIYTKAQLQKELETLATCGMFERVDLEGKTKPDGTLGVTIHFTETTWPSADKFRCINVGLMPQSEPIKMDQDMTEKETLEVMRTMEKDYKRRMDRARPCLLPMSVHREVLQILRGQGKVSARLLQKIRDRVQKWYYDEGYALAQVVNFGNLHTKEVVCEVEEGDITQMVIQFHDKLGNVCEGNTNMGGATLGQGGSSAPLVFQK